MDMPDWVAARHGCSLFQAFQTLREVVDRDVRSAQTLRVQGVTFACDSATNKIVVSRKQEVGGIETLQSVVFELADTEIKVRGTPEPRVLFSVTPNLNPEGECKLWINGTPHEFWQVSRKALEELFFRAR